MWSTVNYKQRQGGRRKTEDNRCDASALPDSVDGDATTCSQQEVSRICKELRRSAAALARRGTDGCFTTLLGSTLFEPVIAFLRTCGTCTKLHCVGLGIGAFHPSASPSPSAFVQMVAFLALREVCTEFLPSTCLISATFFDPVVMELHRQCCQQLDIKVDEDRRGVYSPGADDEALALFMPHCPWVLLHNTVAANWPIGQKDDSLSPSTRIERVLWLANNLNCAPLLHQGPRMCTFDSTIAASFSVSPVEVRPPRHKKTADATKLDSTAAFTGQTISWSVLENAFSDMAVMSVRRDVDPEELRRRFSTFSASPPALILHSPELR